MTALPCSTRSARGRCRRWGRHGAAKRDGGTPTLLLGDVAASMPVPDIDLLALDQMLDRLAALDVRQSRIVDLRFFGGLTIEETAEALRLSPATVKNEWSMARAWLYREWRGESTP